MDVGYVQGKSDNLPKIDSSMMAEFFRASSHFTSAEIRGVKAERSARESYGDSAIGYVQLKREGNLCFVKGRISPEHKMRAKPYHVSAVVDEGEEAVVSAACEDCVAAKGGCKHAIAFLAWIHRRTEDPATTSVDCYWKRSTLAQIGTSIRFVKAKEIGNRPPQIMPEAGGSCLQEFVELFREKSIPDVQLSRYFGSINEVEHLSMHHLRLSFQGDGAAMEFLGHCSESMSQNLCETVAKETKGQADSSLWHELRYGRITASKFYDAAHCHTLEGSLAETTLGARLKSTKAMERGRKLEKKVIQALSKKLNLKIQKCGLVLNREFPFLGASPDGIGDNFVVEVKCPLRESTKAKYFSGNAPAPKHHAQLQLQMLLTKMSKGLFCVADSNFEQSEQVTEMWVEFDQQFCSNLIDLSKKFWCDAIFPRL